MRELAGGDQRVRELTATSGQPQNLVSHHLRQLRAGGLVRARRSSFAEHDTCYSLDLDSCAKALAGAAYALHPGLPGLLGTAVTPSGPKNASRGHATCCQPTPMTRASTRRLPAVNLPFPPAPAVRYGDGTFWRTHSRAGCAPGSSRSRAE